jgi:hypothetical protein
LEKNILDNYLLDEVEFVVLDYNSTDKLGDWIKGEMTHYIELDILVYYRTSNPEVYNRSHSRNMAYRLSRGELVCNLDADNFLGVGFAKKMLTNFQRNADSFYTSNLNIEDVFGKVVLTRSSFLKVKGYNEGLNGYGFEDVDFFSRLEGSGLTHNLFYEPEFHKYISHSKYERVQNEKFFKNLEFIYISYKTPYLSNVIIFYKNNTFKLIEFIDNPHLNRLNEKERSFLERFTDELTYVMINKPLIFGKWEVKDNRLFVQIEETEFEFTENAAFIKLNEEDFYKIDDEDLIIDILLTFSTSLNILEAKKILNDPYINKRGFGTGQVFRNFDYSKMIELN